MTHRCKITRKIKMCLKATCVRERKRLKATTLGSLESRKRWALGAHGGGLAKAPGAVQIPAPSAGQKGRALAGGNLPLPAQAETGRWWEPGANIWDIVRV